MYSRLAASVESIHWFLNPMMTVLGFSLPTPVSCSIELTPARSEGATLTVLKAGMWLSWRTVLDMTASYWGRQSRKSSPRMTLPATITPRPFRSSFMVFSSSGRSFMSPINTKYCGRKFFTCSFAVSRELKESRAFK